MDAPASAPTMPLPIDPVVRHAAREAFSWPRLVPMLPFALIEIDRWHTPGAAGRLGLLALCAAAPAAAAHLIDLEGDGRLDLMRLSGRPPAAIAARIVLGAAAPWLVAGAALVAANVVMVPVAAIDAVQAAAIAGAPLAFSAVSAGRASARWRIDPRLHAAGLGVGALLFAILAGGVAWPGYTRPRVSGLLDAVTSWSTVAIAVEAAIVAWCAPAIVRRCRRPDTAAPARPLFSMFRPRALLRWPGLYRGAALGWSAMLVFLAVGGVVIYARWSLPVFPDQAIALPARLSIAIATSAAAVVMPMVVGMIAIALICREDAESDRLGLIRLSPRRPWLNAMETLLGFWAPFLAATAVIVPLVWVMFDEPPAGLPAIAIVMAVFAPLPALEGWHRIWPMFYAAPMAALLPAIVTGQVPAGFVAPAVVVWAAAGLTLAQPGRPSLSGWPGALGLAGIGLTAPTGTGPGQPVQSMNAIALCGAIAALTPVLIDHRATRFIDRWGQPLAVVLSLALVAAWQRPTGAVLMASLLTTVAMWFVCRRTERLPASAAARAGLRIALVGGVASLLANAAPATTVAVALGALAIAATLAVRERLTLRAAQTLPGSLPR